MISLFLYFCVILSWKVAGSGCKCRLKLNANTMKKTGLRLKQQQMSMSKSRQKKKLGQTMEQNSKNPDHSTCGNNGLAVNVQQTVLKKTQQKLKSDINRCRDPDINS